MPSVLRRVVASTLLGLGLGGAPAQAQPTVEPQGLSVAVPQGETVMQTVTLTNGGTEALTFCLSFDRPLQRTDGHARLKDGTLGGACGDYGEVLLSIDRDDLPGCCAEAVGLTMTPDGRLFGAEFSQDLTYELDAALGYVRVFEHPTVAEFEPFPATLGLAYDAATSMLWWLNIEAGGGVVYRALLLEGDLNGVATGRRIELPIGADLPPDERVSPVGLAYDTATNRFYYFDNRSDTIWAVDTLGTVAEGYPVELQAHASAGLSDGLDVYSTDAEASVEGGVGLRIEIPANVSGQQGIWQIVVADAFGGDTAPGAEPLVTPLTLPLPGTGDGTMGGEPVRSRLDPNGVLYFPWNDFGNTGVMAVRPHPLPPSWLVVEAWDGTLPPGESRTLDLAFRPGQRSVGDYTATLQAFTAETGEAVEVPLTLTVTQGTDVEDEGAEPGASWLSGWPNPLTSSATISYGLEAPSAVRLVVYDVLGREVAVLEDDVREAGTYEVRFDATDLPAGTYFYRLTAGDHVETKQMTIVR